MAQSSNKTAGIIGAGVAGLAASIRLACKGYKVSVYEANAYPGGKLSEIRLNGYRFDAGPSLLTLPEEVDALFRLAGKEPAEHFSYQKLPVSCKYFYEDGTQIEAFAEPERFAEELHEKTGIAPEKVMAAFRNSRQLYELLADLFMHRSLSSWQTWLSPQSFKAYRNLHKMDFFRSMHESNRSLLGNNEKAVQLFNRYATYNGSNPYKAPATLNIIPYLEMGIGAYFPEGGMHAITQSLWKLAKELGVQFFFNQKVEKILIKDKKAVGLLIDGQNNYFDAIISNADMVSTYQKLLKEEPAPRRLLNQPKSSSALIFYWGMKKEFPQLDLHNIFFSKNYEEEFRHIFEKGSIYHDPTVYINITSKYNPSDAPKGAENWFTMINVPNNSGQDWDRLIAEARKNIQEKLNRILGVQTENYIECESILDPRLIETKTSSAKGALYGNSSNSKYAAFLRHANKSSRIEHLYFCGGSVHPGGGIPLCLLSAKITAGLVLQE